MQYVWAIQEQSMFKMFKKILLEILFQIFIQKLIFYSFKKLKITNRSKNTLLQCQDMHKIH